MKILDKLFSEEKDSKKNIYKLLGFLIAGVMLLVTSSALMGTSKKLANNSVESKANPLSREVRTTAAQEEVSYELQMEKRLKSILKRMQGVGEVEVMITTTYGKEIILAEDITNHTMTTVEQDKEGGLREVNSYDDQKKVVMQNANVSSGSDPVIVKEKQPEIQGVLIISEGANHSLVKQSIIEAAQTLLGIPPHRVSVHSLQK